jgi:hypothetical protein
MNFATPEVKIAIYAEVVTGSTSGLHTIMPDDDG